MAAAAAAMVRPDCKTGDAEGDEGDEGGGVPGLTAGVQGAIDSAAPRRVNAPPDLTSGTRYKRTGVVLVPMPASARGLHGPFQRRE